MVYHQKLRFQIVKASKSSKSSSGWIWKPQWVRGTRHSLSFCQCLGDPESLWGARSCARDVPGWGSDQFNVGSVAYHSVAHWIFTHTQVDPRKPWQLGSHLKPDHDLVTWYILVSHGRQCFNHWCEFLRDLWQCSGRCLLALQTCSLSACALKHLPVLDLDGTFWWSWGKLIYTVGSKPVNLCDLFYLSMFCARNACHVKEHRPSKSQISRDVSMIRWDWLSLVGGWFLPTNQTSKVLKHWNFRKYCWIWLNMYIYIYVFKSDLTRLDPCCDWNHQPKQNFTIPLVDKCGGLTPPSWLLYFTLGMTSPRSQNTFCERIEGWGAYLLRWGWRTINLCCNRF